MSSHHQTVPEKLHRKSKERKKPPDPEERTGNEVSFIEDSVNFSLATN